MSASKLERVLAKKVVYVGKEGISLKQAILLRKAGLTVVFK